MAAATANTTRQGEQMTRRYILPGGYSILDPEQLHRQHGWVLVYKEQALAVDRSPVSELDRTAFGVTLQVRHGGGSIYCCICRESKRKRSNERSARFLRAGNIPFTPLLAVPPFQTNLEPAAGRALEANTGGSREAQEARRASDVTGNAYPLSK